MLFHFQIGLLLPIFGACAATSTYCLGLTNLVKNSFVKNLLKHVPDPFVQDPQACG